MSIGIGVLRRLWRKVPKDHPFELLGDVTREWADLVEERSAAYGRPFDPGIISEGVELLRRLPRDSTQRVLLHQDFHPGNVLAAAREPWLAIDPKPLVGDPAFDAVQLLIQTDDVLAWSEPRAVMGHRLEFLAGGLGVDAARIRAWALARSVEWAMWHLKVDEQGGARRAMAIAALLAKDHS